MRDYLLSLLEELKKEASMAADTYYGYYNNSHDLAVDQAIDNAKIDTWKAACRVVERKIKEFDEETRDKQ